MSTDPTGIFVRVRSENGGWENIDIALLSAIQQKDFLSTVDEEKSYAWLPSIIMELCKKQTQNDALMKALNWLVNTIPEPEIELARSAWGNTNTSCVLEARANAVEAIAQVKKGD